MQKDENIESKEELYFMWLLDELYDHGYILGYELKPKPIKYTDKSVQHYFEVKKTKLKLHEEVIGIERIYTPDFRVVWAEKAEGIFIRDFIEIDDRGIFIGKQKDYPLCVGNINSLYEIKGEWDMENMTREFRIKRDILLDHGISVCLIKMPKLFTNLFTPKRYLLTDKTLKKRVLHHEVVTLQQYVEQKIKEVEHAKKLIEAKKY